MLSRWSIRTALPAAIVLLLAVSSGTSCRPRQESAEPRNAGAIRCADCNVVLISIDTLSAKHLASYGYSRQTSPHLDRLAEESVLFEQSVGVGGGTLPVHTSMMTSLFPRTHGVLTAEHAVNARLPEQRVTLAERLREAGFATAAFTDRGWMRARFGLDQGFDVYDDEGGHLDTILPKVGSWLERNADRRFFLFVHTYDVHSKPGRLPYRSPAGFDDLFADPDRRRRFRGCRNAALFEDGAPESTRDRRSRLCASQLLQRINAEVTDGFDLRKVFSADDVAHLVDLYDGGIAYTDARLSELFDRLEALGLWDRSIVVVTSDHGEEFFEHGSFLHSQNHEEVARVPLLIRFPRAEHGGTRVPELVATVDLAPTLLAALGLDPLPASQGLDLLPLLEGGRLERDGLAVYSPIQPKMRTRDRSLVLDRASGAPIDLYDLSVDPWEAEPVDDEVSAASLADRFRQLEAQAVAARRLFEGGATTGMPDAEVDSEIDDELRALGYLDLMPAPEPGAPATGGAGNRPPRTPPGSR